jgi:undecaprenyl diphosphate synthase
MLPDMDFVSALLQHRTYAPHTDNIFPFLLGGTGIEVIELERYAVFDNLQASTYNWCMLESLKDFIKPGSVEESLVEQLDFTKLPRHVAVIMDGNGRWAKKRNLPRVEGHRAGSKSVREIVETCGRLGISFLSLYAFSKENWKRPRKEISTLWRLLEDYLKREDKLLINNNFRLIVIGQRDEIPDSVNKELLRVEDVTKTNTRMTILLALNYGGRAEIVDATRKIMSGRELDPDTLNEEIFSRYLYTADIPDPDLLIRTSGELRISNFLLWQIAYSEIWFTPKYWPDFRKKHLLHAILDYQKRDRRFGDVESNVGNS